MTEDQTPFEWQVISTYSRAQAIEDGSLIDVSATAREAGFTVPVAITAAAWADCVAWDDADTQRQRVHQSPSGRLWDVLWMARCAIKAAPRSNSGADLRYQLYRIPRSRNARFPHLATLKLNSGPGDDGEHVITILLPNED